MDDELTAYSALRVYSPELAYILYKEHREVLVWFGEEVRTLVEQVQESYWLSNR